jgi:hypothetical protein
MRDLFDGTSLELGHAMAELAADHAGEEWKEAAFAAFCRHAERHQTFTTEDVRDANPGLGQPPDLRAWGQVALRAKREKIVKSKGWVSAKAMNVHGNAVTLWEVIPCRS